MENSERQLSMPDNSTLLKAKMRLSINRLLKNYLCLLEEVADEHDEAMGKVCDSVPENIRPLLIVADHFGETRFNAIRKRVLDAGNDSIRDLEDTINNLRIQ